MHTPHIACTLHAGSDKLVVNDANVVLSSSWGQDMLRVMHPTDPLLATAVRSAQVSCATPKSKGVYYLERPVWGSIASLQPDPTQGLPSR